MDTPLCYWSTGIGRVGNLKDTFKKRVSLMLLLFGGRAHQLPVAFIDDVQRSLAVSLDFDGYAILSRL